MGDPLARGFDRAVEVEFGADETVVSEWRVAHPTYTIRFGGAIVDPETAQRIAAGLLRDLYAGAFRPPRYVPHDERHPPVTAAQIRARLRVDEPGPELPREDDDGE